MGTVRTIVDVKTGQTTVIDDRTPEEILEGKRRVATITFADLLRGLVQTNKITVAEAKTWVRTGTLPAAVDATTDALPLEDQIQADRELRYGANFPRNSIAIAAMQTAFNFTDEQVDNFFG